MNKCALPGCERPHHRKHATLRQEGVLYYCRLSHLYYHERDKQTAAWLREAAAQREASAPAQFYYVSAAEAIDAGEHHE